MKTTKKPKQTKDWTDNRHEWAKNATAADQRLNEAVTYYENRYFEDMRFLPGSIAGDVLLVNVDHVLKNKRNKEYRENPFNISLDNYRFRVKKFKDEKTEGCFTINRKTVDICPRHAESPAVILHEMIHVYERILDTVYFNYSLKEILLIRLYEKLRNIIKDLDRVTMAHAHYEKQHENMIRKHGCHGVLFFLKSLDLDLRTGAPPGTIYGYEPDGMEIIE